MPTDGVSRARAIVPAVACAGLALLLYTLTLAPTVYWSDSAELQRVAVTLDLPHPTGYPLYLLLGRAWVTLVPLRDAAWRMNLFSAAAAAAAAGLTSALVQRLSGSVPAAVAAGALLAVSASFWSQAVVAEVYALHALLVVLILIAALRERPSLPVLGLLLGLGLAHHRMTLLLVPGLLVCLVLRRASVPHGWRQLALAAVAFVGALSLYGLTYAAVAWPSRRAFLEYVLHSAPQFWSADGVAAHAANTVWPVVSQQLGGAGLALAAIGALWCWRSDRPCGPATAILLASSWLLGVGFFLFYRPPDMFSFAGHYQVAGAILIGLGVAAVVERTASLSRRSLSQTATAALLVTIGLAIGVQGAVALEAVTQSDDEWLYPRDRAVRMLADVQSKSVLVADPLLGQTARYLRDVEGVRPDVTVVVDPDKELAAAARLLDTGRPVYVWGTGWRDVVAGSGMRLVPAEHNKFDEGLFRLLPTDSPTGWPTTSLGGADTADLRGRAEDGTVIALTDVRIGPWPLVADELAGVVTCWTSDPSERLGRQRLRLIIDPARGWLDHTFPQFEEAQATEVAGGDLCVLFELVLPPAPFSDDVPVELQLTGEEPPSDVELAAGSVPVVASGEGVDPGRMSAATFESAVRGGDQLARAIAGRNGPDALARAGNAPTPGTLLGIAHPGDTRPGVGVPVTAYWWVAPGDDPATPVTWRLTDADGEVVDSAQTVVAAGFHGDAAGGTEPLGETPALVATAVTLTPPRHAAIGPYDIAVAVPGSDGHAVVGRVPVRDWHRAYVVPRLESTSNASLAGAAIELPGFEVVPTLTGLDVRLAWRATAAPSEDWKVFVHLRGTLGGGDDDISGQPAAQSDGFPVGGLRHTDSWAPGEVVEDRYFVQLPTGLPDGRYELVAGLYRPDTGERAPIEGGYGPDTVLLAIVEVVGGVPRLVPSAD
ncbi:MAG: protein O-mannosyl-transferase family [Anaerolineae bacterium]